MLFRSLFLPAGSTYSVLSIMPSDSESSSSLSSVGEYLLPGGAQGGGGLGARRGSGVRGWEVGPRLSPPLVRSLFALLLEEGGTLLLAGACVLGRHPCHRFSTLSRPRTSQRACGPLPSAPGLVAPGARCPGGQPLWELSFVSRNSPGE